MTLRRLPVRARQRLEEVVEERSERVEMQRVRVERRVVGEELARRGHVGGVVEAEPQRGVRPAAPTRDRRADLGERERRIPERELVRDGAPLLRTLRTLAPFPHEGLRLVVAHRRVVAVALPVVAAPRVVRTVLARPLVHSELVPQETATARAFALHP